MNQHNYFIYIVTNYEKTTLYIGVTNDLKRRVYEHYSEEFPGFTKKYKCRYLVYYERFQFVDNAIEREKEVKGWRREKKNRLIDSFNPEWKFLNEEINSW